jgi:ABC-type polysaccharide/polyol phosphate export permease
MLQVVIFVGVFYAMFSILGLRGSAIRGDFLIYIMSGIFLFMTHTKTLQAVVGSEGPANPMMQHAPMNTIISICAAAFGALYIQLLSLFMILFGYHVGVTPLDIDDPIGAFNMLIIAWFSGVALGIVLLAIKPWFPTVVQVATTLYMRANMIASGKMFVANSLPSFRISPAAIDKVVFIATLSPSILASISPPQIAICVATVNNKVGPLSVISRAAASIGLFNRRLARRKDKESIGPEGGTPTCQRPLRPG